MPFFSSLAKYIFFFWLQLFLQSAHNDPIVQVQQYMEIAAFWYMVNRIEAIRCQGSQENVKPGPLLQSSLLQLSLAELWAFVESSTDS